MLRARPLSSTHACRRATRALHTCLCLATAHAHSQHFTHRRTHTHTSALHKRLLTVKHTVPRSLAQECAHAGQLSAVRRTRPRVQPKTSQLSRSVTHTRPRAPKQGRTHVCQLLSTPADAQPFSTAQRHNRPCVPLTGMCDVSRVLVGGCASQLCNCTVTISQQCLHCRAGARERVCLTVCRRRAGRANT